MPPDSPQSAPVDSLATFLQTLTSEGLALVDRSLVLEASAEAIASWHALEEAGRSMLPGDAPPLDAEAGLWGARRLYHACQAIMCRDLDTEEVRPLILAPPPFSRSVAVDYSVDVCLRYLPEVLDVARKLAASDPVNQLLHELAQAWPLSSVGLNLPDLGDVSPFWNHATLRRLYVDRIMAREATHAVQHPLVADAVRAALGAHTSLAPKVAASLTRPSLPPPVL